MKHSFSDVVKSTVVAGLVAALAISLYHFVLTEPVIQRAIDLENEAKLSQGIHEDELLSRPTQHAGLVAGFVIFGLAWALIFAAVYQPLQFWLQRTAILGRVALLVASMYWSVALLPFLKYPANPPGAGEPDTLTQRQALYFGFLALSVLVTGLVLTAGWLAAKHDFLSLSRAQRWITTVASLITCSAILFVVMPTNPDAVNVPSDILTSFRWYSIIGLTLFWALFGACFAALLTFIFKRPVRARRFAGAVLKTETTTAVEA